MPTWQVLPPRMTRNYKVGELVQVVRHGNLTLCLIRSSGHPPWLREMPANRLRSRKEVTFLKELEGKAGLIVYTRKNRLDQVVAYRVLIEGCEVFCKSTVADKYFKLAEKQGDESR